MNPTLRCVVEFNELRCRDPRADAEGAALLFVVTLLFAVGAWARHRWTHRARRRAWQVPPDDGGLYAIGDRVVYRGPPEVDPLPPGGYRDATPAAPAAVRRGEVLGTVGLSRGDMLVMVSWDDGALAELAERHLGHESLYSKG